MDNLTAFTQACESNQAYVRSHSRDEMTLVDALMSSAGLDDSEMKINVLSNLVRSSDDNALTVTLVNLLNDSKNFSAHIVEILTMSDPESKIIKIASEVLRHNKVKHPLVHLSNCERVKFCFDAMLLDGKIAVDLRSDTAEMRKGSQFLLLNHEKPLESWAIADMDHQTGSEVHLKVHMVKDLPLDKSIMPPLIAFTNVSFDKDWSKQKLAKKL